MAEKSELIRVKQPTKDMLDQLKLIPTESFDSVISRILETKLEDLLGLNKETKQVLDKRMDNLRKGKVFGSKDLLERVNAKKKKEIDLKEEM